MANTDLLATKMPLYLSSGTKKITISVTSASSDGFSYPAFSAAVADTGITSVSPYAGATAAAGIANFKAWWLSNPFFVKRINVRATSAANLPSQIIVSTPDPFSGNIQNQIVDIGANTVSTQYQNAIVTIDNLELFVSRNSTIQVVGASTTASQVLHLDFTIVAFISLEFCLQQSILAGALTSENATDVVAAFDNEGTKTAVLDDSAVSTKVQMTPQMRAAVLAGLKNKINPRTFKVNL